jgi:hypothetical protein
MSKELSGYYDAQFTHNGERWGTGKVMLRDGTLWGADAHFVYEGSYAACGGGWVAEVIVRQVAPSAVTIFGDARMEEFVLGLDGSMADGALVFSGAVSQSDSAEICITMRKMAGL